MKANMLKVFRHVWVFFSWSDYSASQNEDSIVAKQPAIIALKVIINPSCTFK